MHPPDRWHLGRRPALDGLRGVAILLVLLAHFDNRVGDPFTGAGVIGVTLFFTLSGFLITALLLEEHDDFDRVSLRWFYSRRARRLLPAVAVVLFAVAANQYLWRPIEVTPSLLASVAFYYSNFWQITAGSAAAFNPLSHTWSLAIEEQFYLVWPTLFLFATARWGRRGVAWAGGIIGSVSIISVLVSTGRWQEWGSLQRSWGLLAGCLLAVWMSTRPERSSSGLGTAACVGGLIPLVFLSDRLPLSLYLIGVPALSGGLLWSVCTGESPRWLAVSTLRWFGHRSYGIYLWHYVVLYALPVDASWAVSAAVRLAITLTLAELSWRFVERPMLRGGVSGARRRRYEHRRSLTRRDGRRLVPASLESNPKEVPVRSD